ncbi:MAG: class I SAM-dependent methyltransferase [Bacteroidales bacterium]|nr:MAG: class I SAM-dependent methyltransferase [Bacteroidales bacterium]
MKYIENWKPSKFVFKKGKLRASRDSKEVGYSSRLVADLVAEFYDHNAKEYIKGNLIDLGCGKVPLYEVYKNLVSSVTCVDWENTIHKNQFLDYTQDLNQPLNFADESFDSIILSDVLEHIRRPEALLKEMNRVLAKNGVLMMNVPFYYCLHEEPFDYYRYTEFALKSMVQDNGFKIIKLETIGGAPEILADIQAKLAIRIPFVGKFLALFIQKITWWFIKTKFGKKVSKQTSKKFPLIYVMVAVKE